MGPFFRKIWQLFRRRRLAEDLRDELEFHRAEAQGRLEARGVGRADAIAASRRALGNESLAREDARELWEWTWLETAWRDLKLAVRRLRREKTFSLAAIATLALGIGATTTVVSVIEAEVWRPLPFASADRLVALSNTTSRQPSRQRGFMAPQYRSIAAGQRTMQAVMGFRWTRAAVFTGGAAAERVRVLPVTASFFSTLDIPVTGGPGFSNEHELTSAAPAVVLTHGFLTRQFPGRADLPGTILVDGRAHEVLGVTPASLHLEFVADPDLFVPIVLESGSASFDVEGQINTVGLLPARMRVPAPALEADIEAQLDRDPDRRIVVRDLKEAYTGSSSRTFTFFLCGVVALLSVACVNVANLLLSRGLARRREFLVRSALGGSRLRIVRQLLMEGAVLAAIAGAAGTALAVGGTAMFSKLAPADYLTRGETIHPDGRVILIAMAISAMTALLFSLVPARFAPGDAGGALGQDARILGGDRRQRRTRSALVFAQLVVAFLLLASAGIFANSFVRLSRAPLGFHFDGLFTFRLLLTGDRYQSAAQRAATYGDLAARLAALPHVSAVTIANGVPLLGGDWMPVRVPGRAMPADQPEPSVSVHVIQPEYFDVFQIPRLAGRSLSATDVDGAPRVVVVNRNLATRYFGGENPLGKTLELRSGGYPADLRPGLVEIVGVVENTKEVGIDEVPFDIVYIPFTQNPLRAMRIVLAEAIADPRRLDAVRSVVAGADPTLPVHGVTTMAQAVGNATKTARFNLMLLGTFAVLALLLASIGVYGTTAYDAACRTSEFGLRVALGARGYQVLRLAVGDSVRLAIAGLVVGATAAMYIARALGDSLYLVPRQHNGVIYQVSLTDPLTLSLAAGTIMIVTLLAALIPARTAARVSPLVALRAE